MRKVEIALLGCLMLIVFIVIPTYVHERVDIVRDAKKGAEQGDAHAQFRLGAIYEEGDLVPQNHSEAFEWYLKSAAKGNAMAEYRLGAIYEEGDMAPRDYSEALNWYLKAARQGLARAQSRLGLMYADGRGTPPDYVEGYAWLSIASEQGDSLGIEARAEMSGKMTNEYMEYSRRRINELKAGIGEK